MFLAVSAVLVVVKVLIVVVGVLLLLATSISTNTITINTSKTSFTNTFKTQHTHKYGTSNDAVGSDMGWVGMLVVAMVRYWWYWLSNYVGGAHVGSCNGVIYDQKKDACSWKKSLANPTRQPRTHHRATTLDPPRQTAQQSYFDYAI